MNSPKRRATHGEDGQALVMLVVCLVGLMAITALAIDFGFIYHAYSELQASAQASATAGAAEMPNTDWATVATTYSGLAGDKNAYGDLTGVTMLPGYPEARCLQYIVNTEGITCDNAVNANAVAVAESVTVPTFFGRVLGISSMTINGYALASMRGGTPNPANVTIVLDSTGSMGAVDTDPACGSGLGILNPTKLQCAKWAVTILLQSMSPCAANLTSCGTVTNGNVPNAVDEVGLLTFPGMNTTAETASDYTSCGSGMQKSYVAPYSLPTISPPYFTIVPPSSNYRNSDSSGLNGTSSNIVQSTTWQDGVGCTSSQYGIQGPGGVNTYYAGVISEAATDLIQLGAPRNTMQNAIIILSDGAATATASDFTAAALKADPTIDQNECHQAITAAQTAAGQQNAAGLYTWVYSVGLGALTSNSCTTDSPAISGCTTMTDIASDPSKFYSDDANGCVSPSHPNITSLGQIFQTVAEDFYTTRLLPFNTN